MRRVPKPVPGRKTNPSPGAKFTPVIAGKACNKKGRKSSK